MIPGADASRSAAALDRALSFLSRAQLPSGQFPMEFIAYDAPDPRTGLAVARPANTPFSTALLAHSLSFSSDPRAQPMIARAVSFLESDRVRGDLWRYWSKDDRLHGQIPADVDDTACVSAVLKHSGSTPLCNTKTLLGNRDARGLFYTWIIPRLTPHANIQWLNIVLGDVTAGRMFAFWNGGAARGDVDSVVNANVLAYLGETRETEPVVDWLLEIARTGEERQSDKWYSSVAAFYYAVSKCHARGIMRLGSAMAFFDRALEGMVHADGRIGADVIQTAIALCARLNFRMSMDEYAASIRFILDEQADDGSWDSCPIYFDGRDQPRITHGSRVATTGFCVEVLSRLA